jgi:hypothetical protein
LFFFSLFFYLACGFLHPPTPHRPHEPREHTRVPCENKFSRAHIMRASPVHLYVYAREIGTSYTPTTSREICYKPCDKKQHHNTTHSVGFFPLFFLFFVRFVFLGCVATKPPPVTSARYAHKYTCITHVLIRNTVRTRPDSGTKVINTSLGGYNWLKNEYKQ